MTPRLSLMHPRAVCMRSSGSWHYRMMDLGGWMVVGDWASVLWLVRMAPAEELSTPEGVLGVDFLLTLLLMSAWLLCQTCIEHAGE